MNVLLVFAEFKSYICKNTENLPTLLLNTKASIIGIERHRLATDGEGITTLVAFHGCRLCCRYCLNPQCLDEDAYCMVITPGELLCGVMKDDLYFTATGGGVTFGGGEPLLHSEFIREFSELKKPEWNIYIETSLNVPQRNLESVLPLVRRFIVDIKDMNSEIYHNYTGQTNAMVLNNLKMLASLSLQENVLVRLPLIPNYNDEDSRKHGRKILEEMGFSHFDEFNYITR